MKYKIMMETIGSDGIKTLGVITTRREIETWQKESYNMEKSMEELDGTDDNSTRGKKERESRDVLENLRVRSTIPKKYVKLYDTAVVDSVVKSITCQ